ncbi:MAG: 23S rRNA (pseudouridine(1915)-N(3))-methyltransferase RlmH [Lachnospiraceae bacterium]|nr:23S rRNA (pseudouridine(1915)-N(3))-methyltransferase RlmH [Lachnospiraceae bacterium]
MKITFICVGKIKEAFYRDAIKEYEKRLSKYTKFEIIEVADEKTPENASDVVVSQILEKEGERILSKVRERSFVTVLAIHGTMMDSVKFSRYIEEHSMTSGGDLTFIIGGSLGTSPKVNQRADALLSFSPMTFPHQLMRVVLLEQIYRAYRISNNEPYHK